MTLQPKLSEPLILRSSPSEKSLIVPSNRNGRLSYVSGKSFVPPLAAFLQLFAYSIAIIIFILFLAQNQNFPLVKTERPESKGSPLTDNPEKELRLKFSKLLSEFASNLERRHFERSSRLFSPEGLLLCPAGEASRTLTSRKEEEAFLENLRDKADRISISFELIPWQGLTTENIGSSFRPRRHGDPDKGRPGYSTSDKEELWGDTDAGEALLASGSSSVENKPERCLQTSARRSSAEEEAECTGHEEVDRGHTACSQAQIGAKDSQRPLEDHCRDRKRDRTDEGMKCKSKCRLCGTAPFLRHTWNAREQHPRLDTGMHLKPSTSLGAHSDSRQGHLLTVLRGQSLGEGSGSAVLSPGIGDCKRDCRVTAGIFNVTDRHGANLVAGIFGILWVKGGKDKVNRRSLRSGMAGSPPRGAAHFFGFTGGPLGRSLQGESKAGQVSVMGRGNAAVSRSVIAAYPSFFGRRSTLMRDETALHWQGSSARNQPVGGGSSGGVRLEDKT